MPETRTVGAHPGNRHVADEGLSIAVMDRPRRRWDGFVLVVSGTHRLARLLGRASARESRGRPA
jgi:hypothetical protein